MDKWTRLSLKEEEEEFRKKGETTSNSCHNCQTTAHELSSTTAAILEMGGTLVLSTLLFLFIVGNSSGD